MSSQEGAGGYLPSQSISQSDDFKKLTIEFNDGESDTRDPRGK